MTKNEAAAGERASHVGEMRRRAAHAAPTRLDDLELATVLSALRYWQAAVEDESNPATIHFADEEIGTLDGPQIDRLCEKLNR